MRVIKYHNEANNFNFLQNLIINGLKTMEQILFLSVRCVLKLFRKKGNKTMLNKRERIYHEGDNRKF